LPDELNGQETLAVKCFLDDSVVDETTKGYEKKLINIIRKRRGSNIIYFHTQILLREHV
jgi:hypothetical protein